MNWSLLCLRFIVIVVAKCNATLYQAATSCRFLSGDLILGGKHGLVWSGGCYKGVN